MENKMNWEPWTGCYQISDGCANCYFYGKHAKRCGQNKIALTDKFDWPVQKDKNGLYRIQGNKILPTCFATDFFLPEADEWRKQAWAIIKERQDIQFLILTKRIDRFLVSLPEDWGDGYENVNLGCTVENQLMADYRLPLFLSYPIKHRFIACAPLLESMDIKKYLHGVEHVTVSGESGVAARVCDYKWVNNLYQQCLHAQKTFWFKSTGTFFIYNNQTTKVNPFKQTTLAKSFKLDLLGDKKLF